MKRLYNYKRWMAAMAAGVMLSLNVAGSAMAEEQGGPGVVNTTQESQRTGGYWEQRGVDWYYLDAAGNPMSGWVQVSGKHFYLEADGRCLMNTVTPDGYYVSPSGEWFVRTTGILGLGFTAAERFPDVNASWTGTKPLGELSKTIRSVFEERELQVTGTSVEYVRGEDSDILMGVYKDTASGSYRLKLACKLNKGSTAEDKAATYDYAVFRAMLYQVTSTPELLEDAVYNSWQEDNRWQINRSQFVQVGDSLVMYSAGDGYGYYYIYPVR